MNKLLLSSSLLCLLVISGCSSSELYESNADETISPTIEVTNHESEENTEDVVDVKDQFNPDTILDDNYIWMEGVIEQAEKTEMGYRFTIVPWSQDPSITYNTLTVEANSDLEIRWSTDNKVLSFEELEIDEIARLVRVEVLLENDIDEANLIGKITAMSLLIG